METPFVNIHTHRPTGHGIEPASVGIHPWEAAEGDLATVREPMSAGTRSSARSASTTCVPTARRNCGFSKGSCDWPRRPGKPVVLHCVKAFEETMRLLKQFRLRAVIFHGFIGSPEQAARAVAAGYYLSFGSRSLRSPRTVRALGSIPTQRLFLETDDAPATIESVYATAARLLDMPLDRLKETIYNNYLHIFS